MLLILPQNTNDVVSTVNGRLIKIQCASQPWKKVHIIHIHLFHIKKSYYIMTYVYVKHISIYYVYIYMISYRILSYALWFRIPKNTIPTSSILRQISPSCPTLGVQSTGRVLVPTGRRLQALGDHLQTLKELVSALASWSWSAPSLGKQFEGCTCGHVPVVTGYKWDYTFYKWDYKLWVLIALKW